MDAKIEEVKGALIALVAGIKEADNHKMLASMERLDRIVADDHDALDPRLVHFLERRSYVKALDLLGGAPDIPRGTCGPT